MSAIIEKMLKNYNVENLYDKKNAMKKIMQKSCCAVYRAVSLKGGVLWRNRPQNLS